MSVDREFVRETDDAVRQLTVELVDLEESADRETLDEAFRRTHALKGNLGMVGLEDARDLAHALEDVLDAIRAGERRADRTAIDAALDAADEIGRAVERAHRGEPAPDLDPLTDRLRGLAEESDPDAAPRSSDDGDETGVEGGEAREDEPGAETSADDAGDDGTNELEEAGFVFEPAGESADETADDVDEAEPEFDDEVEAALEDASQFDDLDALVEEVDDASEFDDLEGGGSFDDVLDEEPDAGLEEPTATEGFDDPTADESSAPAADEGFAPVDDLGLGGADAGHGADAGRGLDGVAGDAFDDPSDDALEDEPADGIEDAPADDVGGDPAADLAGAPGEATAGGVGEASDEASPGDDATPGDDDTVTGDDAVTAGDDEGADTPPSSPGGAFDEFQEIQQEVDQDDDLDQLQRDIEETNFGEFDDEDDMTIDELLVTEMGDSSADAEPAGADPGGAFDGSTEAGTGDGEPAVEADATTAETRPVDGDAADGEPAETEPAETGPTDPSPADPEPATADVEPAIREMSAGDTPDTETAADTSDAGTVDADAPPAEAAPADATDVDATDADTTDADTTTADAIEVESAVRKLPDEEPEPEPEPEPAVVPVEASDEAVAESEPEPAIREVADAADSEVPEPAVRESGEPEPVSAGDDGYEPAITEIEPAITEIEPGGTEIGAGGAADALAPAEPADGTGPEEPATADGVESEPAAAGDEAELDPEVEALLSEVDVSESEAPVDASLEADAADAGASGSLSGFSRDEATDAFEARFGDLFAAEADSEASDAPTVPTIADSDLDQSAFRDDGDGEGGLPARQRTTAPASLSVDPEVGDELLRQVRELAAASRRLAAAADRTDPEVRDALSALRSATDDVRQTALEVRLMPLSTVTDGFDRVVRDVARDAGVEVSFETHGTDVHLDRDVLDRIGDPLVHLVRNAVDHGIEAPEEREAAGKPREGTVELRARREGDAATIEVRDDGGGLDPEAVRETAIEEGLVTEGEAAALSRRETFGLLFEPGFSTTDEVTETSGRGVGMDAVARAVAELNGSVAVESDPGEGTTVRLSVPVTVAVAEVVFLRVGDEQYAVPTADVESVQYATETVVEDGEVRVPTADGEASYPLVRLGEALDAADGGSEHVVVRVDPDIRGVALGADGVGEKREVVITPYEDVLGGTPGIGGATLLEDNTVVNVIDVETL